MEDRMHPVFLRQPYSAVATIEVFQLKMFLLVFIYYDYYYAKILRKNANR